MNERTLYTISLITLVSGLIFLYFMSEEISIDTIQNLDQVPQEKTVRIAGIITRLHQAEKAYFLQVEGQETTTMDIIFFPNEDIFIEELFAWCTEESWWPQNRTKEMFWQWFEAELHSIVRDPYTDPIEKEES